MYSNICSSFKKIHLLFQLRKYRNNEVGFRVTEVDLNVPNNCSKVIAISSSKMTDNSTKIVSKINIGKKSHIWFCWRWNFNVKNVFLSYEKVERQKPKVYHTNGKGKCRFSEFRIYKDNEIIFYSSKNTTIK